MQYDWIDFYTEFATKLLPFENDRNALIQKINAVYVLAGLSIPKLESGDEIIDIDTFTMCRLYEKFILEYYRKEYKNQIIANASRIPWQLDDEENSMLPVMQSDIMFQRNDRVLIIDAKYYEHSTQVQFDTHTLH